MDQNNSKQTFSAPPEPVANDPSIAAPQQPATPESAPLQNQTSSNTPQVIQPSISPTPTKPHKSHWVAKAAGLIIVALLIFGGYIFGPYNPNSYKLTYTTPHYGPLQTVKVTIGPDDGSAFLSVPTEFVDSSGATTHKQAVNLINNEVSNHNIRQLALINFNSSSHPVHKDAFYTRYKAILANPKDTDYKEALAPLKTSTTQLLGNSYTCSFASPQPFRSENIKDNSWTLDFSASLNKANTKMPANVKGRVLLAFSKDYTYYLIVYADSNNWKANTATWQQVFNSLQFNQ